MMKFGFVTASYASHCTIKAGFVHLCRVTGNTV